MLLRFLYSQSFQHNVIWEKRFVLPNKGILEPELALRNDHLDTF